jgi:phosphate transport system permease protein
MNTLLLILVVLALAGMSYVMGSRRSTSLVNNKPKDLHSLPGYYGLYVAMWCGVPALALLAVWVIFEPVIIEQMVLASLPAEAFLDANGATAAAYQSGLASTGYWAMVVVVLAMGMAMASFAYRRLAPSLRARNAVETGVKYFMIACSTVAILTTVGIVLSLLFESFRFFTMIPITDFLFGLSWSPQMAMRADQVGSSGAFGAVPLFLGTGLIASIALLVAVPIGLLSAIYMSEYAAPKFRSFAKPALEILAGIPTVVYGFFAALTVAPAIRGMGEVIGLSVSSESALAAGVVMGIMIIPFVSSLSDDVITAVPQAMREGSYGLGATRSETIRRVVFPAALPGIVGGVLLAASRAIGETMIVVMAAGLAANLTANPFEAVTTVTVQIVTLLVGDQEFDSPKTLAAFALGLVLFFLTLILNVIALHVVRKYREQYD